jgi:hypothetical protein
MNIAVACFWVGFILSEGFVRRNKSRLRTLSFENRKLPPKSQVFQK